MLTFVMSAITFGFLLLSLFFYKKLIGMSDALNIIEKQVAADMEIRRIDYACLHTKRNGSVTLWIDVLWMKSLKIFCTCTLKTTKQKSQKRSENISLARFLPTDLLN
uniref:hypothetical protein n=1 Tax=Acinetobacter gerneri TaxID=202952 RepID=UPI00293BA67D|nr:hypothetical protein [Acinetobacter gerneri]WNL65345.1 hypothetical protein GPGIFMOB_00296 [Acinetobacter gerneri]